ARGIGGGRMGRGAPRHGDAGARPAHVVTRDGGGAHTDARVTVQQRGQRGCDGDIELHAIVHHAGGGEGGAVAEVRCAAVVRERIEADAQFGAPPPDVAAFGGETQGGGEGEGAAGGEGAAPFHVDGVGLGDQRIDVQALAQRDGGRAVS